jgi:hypothetical protein
MAVGIRAEIEILGAVNCDNWYIIHYPL